MSQHEPRPLLPEAQTFSSWWHSKEETEMRQNQEQPQSRTAKLNLKVLFSIDFLFLNYYLHLDLSIGDKSLLLPLDLNDSAMNQTEALK